MSDGAAAVPGKDAALNNLSPPKTVYRDRDFYFFVAARFWSTCAMQVQSVAIGWQVYELARTPLALGLVGLCQFGPMLLLTLPAGARIREHIMGESVSAMTPESMTAEARVKAMPRQAAHWKD